MTQATVTRDTTSQSDLKKMKHEPDGSFKRPASSYRDWIKKGGKFEPEKDRYHLYASYGCPWATRTLIVRKLKGLEEIIPVSILSPRNAEHGFPFAAVDPFPRADHDPLFNAGLLRDVYLKIAPDYTGRFTVPMLFDKKLQTIVNNESSEIIRMFNSEFNDFIAPEKAAIDLYPAALRAQIDDINPWIYDDINNGVYKSGFAKTQEAYEKAVVKVFEGLDRVEQILEGREYLVGDQLTEADVRLWVTVIRFDVAYHGNFKCNFRTIRGGYPNIHKWLRTLYWTIPAFKDSTDFNHIKTGYHWSMAMINPTRIVPLGPIPHILPL